MEYSRVFFVIEMELKVKITKKHTTKLKKIDNASTASNKNTAIIDIYQATILKNEQAYFDMLYM